MGIICECVIISDSYGGSVDESYEMSTANLPMAASLPVQGPGPSTSSQSANRPRGNIPGELTI